MLSAGWEITRFFHSTRSKWPCEWLDSTDLTSKTLIDYGCGSGMPAIAAARLDVEPPCESVPCFAEWIRPDGRVVYPVS